MKCWFQRFKRDEAGIAYLEFALTLPLLLALFMGAVEVTRYIIIAQKVEKASVSVTDIVAQAEEMTAAQLDVLVLAATEVVRPYPFGANGYIIVSSVSKTGTNPPVMNWQYTSSGASGSWTHASLIGVPSTTPTLPPGFTLNDKDNVIIAEVFYNYAPLMASSVISGSMIYKFAVFKPRLGNMTSLGS